MGKVLGVVATAIGLFVLSIVVAKIFGNSIIEYIQWAQGVGVSF